MKTTIVSPYILTIYLMQFLLLKHAEIKSEALKNLTRLLS